jgi:hypothetical protein
MIRIVDNKKVDMTDDEWQMYNKIVKSYTSASNKGEDLFTDLFHSDNKGVIVFLKPPSTRQTSLEVFLFLMSLMQNQHMRVLYDRVDDVCAQMKDKMKEIDAKLSSRSKK